MLVCDRLTREFWRSQVNRKCPLILSNDDEALYFNVKPPVPLCSFAHHYALYRGAQYYMYCLQLSRKEKNFKILCGHLQLSSWKDTHSTPLHRSTSVGSRFKPTPIIYLLLSTNNHTKKKERKKENGKKKIKKLQYKTVVNGDIPPNDPPPLPPSLLSQTFPSTSTTFDLFLNS